jgi:hypothetical protein
MKRGFITPTGRMMAVGIYFNWIVDRMYIDNTGPLMYRMFGSNGKDSFSILWQPHIKLLSMGANHGLGCKLYCEKQRKAEIIVMAFLKGNNFEIPKEHGKNYFGELKS